MAETVRTFPLEEQIKIKGEVFRIVNDAESRLARTPRETVVTTQPTRTFYEQASTHLSNEARVLPVQASDRSYSMRHSGLEDLEANDNDDYTLTHLY